MENQNKKLRQKILLWAGILFAQIILFYIFSKSEWVLYVHQHFFEYQKYLHQWFFAWADISIGDVCYIVLGILLVFFFFKIFRRKTRFLYLKRLLLFLNVMYFLYQIFWGLLYFQPPLKYQLSPEEPTTEEMKALTWKYLELCKQSRELVQEDEHGVFKIPNTHALEVEILRKQNQLPLIFQSKKGTAILAFKASIFGSLMSYTGILGYYNPFTAEAQYNKDLPHSYLPFTLAHESAHQLGIAREQEANFIGYLIGKNSTNVALRHSVNWFVLKSLLNALIDENAKFVENVKQSFNDGMNRDLMYEKYFFEKHQGALMSFFHLTNDWFLKSNRQEGSITYSYFVDLLVRYERNAIK